MGGSGKTIGSWFKTWLVLNSKSSLYLPSARITRQANRASWNLLHLFPYFLLFPLWSSASVYRRETHAVSFAFPFYRKIEYGETTLVDCCRLLNFNITWVLRRQSLMRSVMDWLIFLFILWKESCVIWWSSLMPVTCFFRPNPSPLVFPRLGTKLDYIQVLAL